MRQRRRLHDPNEHERACARAWTVITSHRHDVIATYDAFRDELTVASLQQRASAAGKTNAVPVLSNGAWRFGVDASTIDVFVVPGLAFDNDGNRLGYGKGVYDRLLLQKRKSALVLGICFSVQRVARVPHDLHDVPMDVVVDADRVTWGLHGRENVETTADDLSSRR
jgi:5-formyltetrahydrofolate cyclo-ligase